MTKIQILSQDVINKIAAGEVVERPASVVKELLENSIDAKANTIKIEIQEGGIKKILISDNGVGMTLDDLKLCILPHATSKLRSEDDLMSIKSYGFRGEALSSIAAVSKLTIRSKVLESDTGYEIKVEGGELKEINEVGMANGTTIIVENLFYNVPARLEFTKNVSTEFKYILEIITSIALANSNLGFSLTNDDKNTFNLAKDHQLEDRVRALFGNDFFEKLLPIFYEHPHIEMFGFIGKPELASSKKKEQYIFINKRPIKDKTITFAVKDTYGGLLPPGSMPAYILFIDVPENIVDVNVHPRKEEVRFSNSQLIFTAIKSAVKRALDTSTLTPGSQMPQGMPGQMPPGYPPMSPAGTMQAMPGMAVPRPYPYATMPGAVPPGYPPMGMGGMPVMPRPMPYPTMPGMPVQPPMYPTLQPPMPVQPQVPMQQGVPAVAPIAPGQGVPPARPNMPVSGTVPLNPPVAGTMQPPIQPRPQGMPMQSNYPFWNDPYAQMRQQYQQPRPNKFLKIHKLYILSESKDGVIIYDQHAVHERIIYEKLTRKHEDQKDQAQKQGMLAPVVVTLSYHENEIYQEFKDKFTELGFEIEDFGPNTYKLTTIPAVFTKMNVKDLFHELLEDLGHDEKLKEIDSVSDKILKYLSCRSAYKAGDTITDEEITAMLAQLESGQNTYTCPHGRPVKVELTLQELDKMFKRTGFD